MTIHSFSAGDKLRFPVWKTFTIARRRLWGRLEDNYLSQRHQSDCPPPLVPPGVTMLSPIYRRLRFSPLRSLLDTSNIYQYRYQYSALSRINITINQSIKDQAPPLRHNYLSLAPSLSLLIHFLFYFIGRKSIKTLWIMQQDWWWIIQMKQNNICINTYTFQYVCTCTHGYVHIWTPINNNKSQKEMVVIRRTWNNVFMYGCLASGFLFFCGRKWHTTNTLSFPPEWWLIAPSSHWHWQHISRSRQKVCSEVSAS